MKFANANSFKSKMKDIAKKKKSQHNKYNNNIYLKRY